MTVREQFEEIEDVMLGPFAAHSRASQGRERPESEHEYRTAFQRDRDRILHSKAFRRLKRKTQVFLAPEGDHYRTRLTHTLEASQIARTAARALRLNEDLTEAIALGHDLGHTPFGHAGESTLNEVFEEGFRHAEQSLRVVDKLEPGRDGQGLNLTFEVRDGILHHSKGRDILEGLDTKRAVTLEGQLVSVCDGIAYINHDIDDALRAKVITLNDLPEETVRILGDTTSKRINTMVTALLQGSQNGSIGITPEILDITNTLRQYMYTYVYPCPVIRDEIAKTRKMLRELYYHLLEHPTPELVAETEAAAGDSLERRVVDFLASMTDQYAMRLYEQIFYPSAWRR